MVGYRKSQSSSTDMCSESVKVFNKYEIIFIRTSTFNTKKTMLTIIVYFLD